MVPVCMHECFIYIYIFISYIIKIAGFCIEYGTVCVNFEQRIHTHAHIHMHACIHMPHTHSFHPPPPPQVNIQKITPPTYIGTHHGTMLRTHTHTCTPTHACMHACMHTHHHTHPLPCAHGIYVTRRV